MNGNYFFFDGSALAAQIRTLQRAQPKFRKRILCPQRFVQYIGNAYKDLHSGSYKRAVFYFPRGSETSIYEYIADPEFGQPGLVRDIDFKFCGHKLKKSAEFDEFVEEKVPTKFHDRFQKSEKGIDLEICCDALRLASRSQIDRLLLLTNDGDNLPLIKILKEFGCNISILHLSRHTPPNSDLIREADSYDTVADDDLDALFLESAAEDETSDVAPGSEKAEPSLPSPKREPRDTDETDKKV